MLAALMVIPVLALQLLRPDISDVWFVVGLAPAFFAVQFSLYLATLCEADKVRALRRDVPRWRLLTGTAPRGFEAKRLASEQPDRRLSARALRAGAVGAVLMVLYAVAFFGWHGVVVLTTVFWAGIVLYQFTFSSDNSPGV